MANRPIDMSDTGINALVERESLPQFGIEVGPSDLDPLRTAALHLQRELNDWKDAGADVHKVTMALHTFVAEILKHALEVK